MHSERRLVTLLLTVLTLGLTGRVASANNIQTENLKPGTTEWQLTNYGYANGPIEGYASLTSVNRGGQIKFFVNTAEPTYTMDIFRLGDYGGLGARRMMATIPRTGTAQVIPIPDPTTGLIECDWTDPYVLTIPASADPTDWMSGFYLVKLTAGTSGMQQYIIFTVRDDARATDLLLAQTVNTYEAYNPWGGKSLYGTIVNRADTANAAHKVSFNRPYFGEQANGAASLFAWEYPMAQWLEREGYDISYATNIDVDQDPNLLLNHKAFLSIGHDEYWSWRMRDNVEAARDRGINLGFFSGNTSYWQVRYEPSVLTGDPARTMVGYKEAWRQDPITPDYLKTNEFRYTPVNRSEDQMNGVMYITQARPAMVIEDASSWVLTGTGLNNGDRLVNPDGTPFLGYEVDGMNSGSPANTQRIGHSPAESDAENYSDMTVYRAASGATVFATGSIAWSVTIPQILQITRNVLSRFITGSFADTTPVRASLPSPWMAQDIGAVGRAGFVGAASPQSLTLNGAGQGIFGDAFYYVYQPLAGDGTIVTRLNGLQLFWDNRAGVMIRESLSPDSKFVSLVGRPTGSRGSLLEGEEFYTRSATGGGITFLNQTDMPLPAWLQLSRTGDVFNASVSSDGVSWMRLGTATVPMNSNVFIGFNVASARQGVWVTANFDTFSVTSGGGGTGTCSSVALSQTSFYSGALESNWTVAVTAPDDVCTWSAVSDSPWLQATSIPPVPAGSGTLLVKVLTNTGPPRTAHFTIGGVTYTVPQDPAAGFSGTGTCSSVALSQTSFYSGPLESNWTVAVTAPDDLCTWSAVSDSPWLQVASIPSVPAGSGTLSVKVLTNTGPSRTAHFTIGGVTYTVPQDPAAGFSAPVLAGPGR
jgi:hypothetical protein